MKRVLFYLVFCITLCSCSETETVDDEFLNSNFLNGNVLIKERDSNYPWQSKETRGTLKSRVKLMNYASLSHRMYLGHSFKNTYYPLEDTRNLGFQVINLEKFTNDYPSYVRSFKNNTGEATYFSYATLDRYSSNSTVTKSVSGGFNLNLGLFSIGNKNNLKNVFTTSVVDNSNTTFGELNIILRDSCYQI